MEENKTSNDHDQETTTIRLYEGENREDNSNLTVRALMAPATLDLEARTVEVTFATETPVARRMWDEENYRYVAVQEILDCQASSVNLTRFESGLPLYDSHNYYSGLEGVLGVCTAARFQGRVGICLVRFAKTEEGDKAMALVADGIIKTVSIGYRVDEYTITKKAEGPHEYRATKWEPMELSLAPMPADPKAQVRNSAGNEAGLINNNIRKMENQEAPKAPGTTLVAPDPAEIRSAAIKEERARVDGIRNVAKLSGLGDEQVSEAIKDNTTVDQFRALALEAMATRQAQTMTTPIQNASARGGEVEQKREAMIAGMLLRSGKAQGKIDDKVKTIGQKYQRSSLLEMARFAIEGEIDTRGMTAEEIVTRAITSSTSDFPIILGGVIHQVLLADYEIVARTWSLFCKTGSVSDFRNHDRIRRGSLDRLSKVNENGEFTMLSLPDGTKETVKAESFGNLINVSRKMLINDDLGAFTDLASLLGQAAARSIELDVYAALAENSGAGPTMSDGNPLFHSSHSNVGTGAALSAAAIMADRNLFRRQKDRSGKEFINVSPDILLIPVELYDTAATINDAQYNPDALANGKQYSPNTVRNTFSRIVDTPYLTGTRRYLFANPSIHPALEVSFLNGVSTPMLDMQEGWSSAGMEWKVMLDYGVGAVDWVGAVTNAGA